MYDFHCKDAVDKTLFIKELLESWGEVNLFTWSRQFGKTVMANMSAAYFGKGIDSHEEFDTLKVSGYAGYIRRIKKGLLTDLSKISPECK